MVIPKLLEKNCYIRDDNIQKLRQNFDIICQYIYEEDTINIRNKKKDCILFKLSNCSENTKNKINNKFGNDFISKIISYLTNINIEYTDLTIEE
jgi:hypothetical protein